MNLIQRALALREGGQTARCHTMQYVGTYNVAIHSYNMMTLLFVLHPAPSINLIHAVQFHDVPERWTGDVPTPAKMASATFKSELVRLEEKVLDALGLVNMWSCLTAEEKRWLNAIDLLELFIWGQEQAYLGNQICNEMNKQIQIIFENKWDSIPIEVRNFMEKFKFSRSVECEELING